MSDNFLYVQNQPTTLAGAGVSLGDTSITLTSFLQIDGSTTLTMANFGTIGYGTLEPNNGTQEEQISFSGIVQNANGTATLTSVKTVLFISPYTESSGLAKTHPGGVQFVVSNTAAFYDKLTSKNDDETVGGTWTFTAPNYPQIDTPATLPTLSAQFATKQYVDGVAVAGAPDATTTVKGIVELATAAETAAGTATGGTAANLVPANSTFNATSSAAILVPVTNASGKLSAGFGGSASTLATLDGSSLVVQNPANATVTRTASKIPIADSSGTVRAFGLFGGTGADGALTLTSGTTTISLGSASVVVKNYTSISITGTGALAFSNPHANGTIIILKSQGGVTITTSANPAIDLRSLGATAGSTNGAAGSNGNGFFAQSNKGNGGVTSVATSASGGNLVVFNGASKGIPIFVGAGGGSGFNATPGTQGAGGRGAGALYMECAGAYNVTATFNAAGTAGSNGTGGNVTEQRSDGGGGGSVSAGGGGANSSGGASPTGSAGGGGGGGTIFILYNSLTADSGTYTVTGGASGTGGGGVAGTGTGGAGLAYVALNNDIF